VNFTFVPDQHGQEVKIALSSLHFQKAYLITYPTTPYLTQYNLPMSVIFCFKDARNPFPNTQNVLLQGIPAMKPNGFF
jgi:hypothetical protein